MSTNEFPDSLHGKYCRTLRTVVGDTRGTDEKIPIDATVRVVEQRGRVCTVEYRETYFRVMDDNLERLSDAEVRMRGYTP